MLWSVLVTGFSVAQGRSPNTKTLLKRADNCRRALHRSQKKKQYRHNWFHCLNGYEKLYSRYPKSAEAPWALYQSARLYRELYRYSGSGDDLDRAVTLFKRLTEAYSKHRLADDSQYKIGEIYYKEKDDPTQAYVEFLKVDIKYPRGDMRAKARIMLDELADIINEREKRKKAMPSREGGRTKVTDIRHWSTPSYTRVVIDLEQPVKYKSTLLKEDPNLNKPERLFVDLQKTFVTSGIESSIPIKDGLLKRARAGQYNRQTVRVVLDIESIGGYKIFHLHDPFRIVVDVQGIEKKKKRAPKKTVKARKRPVRKGIRRVKKPDKKVSLARQLGLSVSRIVIDPGHGGKDPGCYIKGGIKEKTIVLKLAKSLKKKVEEQLGCEVILTRTKDVFLSLENRTAFANMKKGDLFISLHINAHKQRNVHGIETYFLNMATDERAVLLAARENATSEKNISDLQTILNDLMLNTKISESSKLAYEVQNGMVKKVKGRYKRWKSLGVKQAPFAVLIGAQMPAILIETGFITNPTERKRLLSKTYLDTLADGIVAGIRAYMESIDLASVGG
jgi:N-acetylmuramoyl-L-alanine amidase